MEALERPGCPLCRLADEAGRRFLRALLYERVNDVPTRNELRRGGGFCRLHTGLLLSMGDALGASIIYADLLRSSSAAPASDHTCLVCVAAQSATHRAMAALSRHIEEPDVLAAYSACDGLCLPHLAELTGPGADTIADIERERMEALAAECLEFVAKSDYRRRNEPMAAERDAWRRAALKLAGGVPDRRA